MSQDETPIRTPGDLAAAVRAARRDQELKQLDIAGLANTGNRFIVELEQGKPTLQLGKVLEVLDLLGLDVVLRRRGAR